MSKHLWMQDLSFAAYCPKCNDVNFKRSNTRSGIEKLVRRYSHKVPYRCHSCGFRTLIDPTNLHYPASSQAEFTKHEDFASDVEIPDGTLSSIMANSQDKDKSESGKPAHIEEKSPKKETEQPEIDNPDAEMSLKPEKNVNEGEEGGIFPDFTGDSEPAPVAQRLRSTHQHAHPAACPACGERSLHRSHSRSVVEAGIKKLSKKRLYRCHKCNWRGWLQRHM